jgi:formylglycine-generating enzyme required for sulfatase activity
MEKAPIVSFRIFLSSPGDVAEERTQARELLLGLERGPFVRGRIHIDVVSWDDPHAPAAMDGRYTPQQAVDRNLPTPDQCELTVVLLWSRMGTPLTETRADGTPYLSGTEWELEKALGAGKPVLLYRRSSKALLDPDDPEVDDKLAQKRRVDTFFAGLKRDDGAMTMAYATYASSEELLTRLRQNVESYLANRLDDATGAPVGDSVRRGVGARPPDVPVAYREWVKKKYGGVDLLGVQLKKSRPPSLSAIYVPQTTTAAPISETARGTEKKKRRKGQAGIDVDLLGRERDHEPTLALSRLAAESLYVAGPPGAGKSTFCRWVAWLVAEGDMPTPEIAPPERFAETLDKALQGRLPVLLRLRELWEHLPVRIGATLARGDLEAAIGRRIEQLRPDGLDAAIVQAHIDAGTALLILDGVDEVPVSHGAGAGRWLPREQVLAALADACPAWCRAGNRMLLTSRPYGLADERAARMGLSTAPLNLLPRELQELLAERWFTVLAGESRAGRATAADLFAEIGSQPWLVELAANPLLLTAMAIVYDEGKRLPQDKHELYERVVATVLYTRYQTPADIDRVKRELGVIAYGMHTGAGIDSGRATPRAEATFHEVEWWLKAYQAHLSEYTATAETTAFDTRDALLSHSGLLLSTGDDRVGFAHLSFQEFFAAQRSFSVDERRLADVFATRAETPDWRNTLSFLFGRVHASFPEAAKAIELLETQLQLASADTPSSLLVLTDAALILMGKGTPLRDVSRTRLQQSILDGMVGSAPVAVRAELGSALGRLGDPRFRADRWYLPDEDLLGFIKVEAGPFTMGSAEADKQADQDEKPQHTVDLPEFYVARYTVTVAQFRAFVEDVRFEPRFSAALRGAPNHPVTFVPYREALAYCRWLTGTLRAEESTPTELRSRLQGGWEITLPSEAEWEKAARGRDARTYPWGNQYDPARANGLNPTLGFITAAGLFPSGVSPYGALDMIGNVREWTRSRFKGNGDYPYPSMPSEVAEREQLDAADENRVVRGGFFFDDQRFLRAPFRNWSVLDGNFSVGFRLVVSRLRS